MSISLTLTLLAALALVTADLAALQRDQAMEACGLLTADEIHAVTGATVSETKPEMHGTTATCNYHASGELMPAVSLVLAQGMPKVSSSKEMAAWRSKQGATWGDIKVIIEPLEGLGYPAIRNEVEGVGLVTVEMAVKGRLLDVTTAKLDHSKALVTKASGRLR